MMVITTASHTLLAVLLASWMAATTANSRNRNVASFAGFFGSTAGATQKKRAVFSKQQPNTVVLPLLEAASKRQSITNRIKVERLIDELAEAAFRNKKNLRKPIQPGSYRTIWSTVTADNFLGFLLNNPPSNVLGGPSWQVVSPDMTEGENIVYWKSLGVRMAGLARLSPLLEGGGGYGLQIRGLEFRWGAGGCPEKEGSSELGKTWRLFKLPEDETLGNGVGTLELLYNDGVVRVTKDNVAGNTYVHIKEPLSEEFDKMFSTQGF